MGLVPANDVLDRRSTIKCDGPRGFRPMDPVATNDVSDRRSTRKCDLKVK